MSQMMGKTMLDGYLAEGLLRLRANKIDVDTLLRPSRSGK